MIVVKTANIVEQGGFASEFESTAKNLGKVLRNVVAVSTTVMVHPPGTCNGTICELINYTSEVTT